MHVYHWYYGEMSIDGILCSATMNGTVKTAFFYLSETSIMNEPIYERRRRQRGGQEDYGYLVNGFD